MLLLAVKMKYVENAGRRFASRHTAPRPVFCNKIFLKLDFLFHLNLGVLKLLLQNAEQLKPNPNSFKMHQNGHAFHPGNESENKILIFLFIYLVDLILRVTRSEPNVPISDKFL